MAANQDQIELTIRNVWRIFNVNTVNFYCRGLKAMWAVPDKNIINFYFPSFTQ